MGGGFGGLGLALRFKVRVSCSAPPSHAQVSAVEETNRGERGVGGQQTKRKVTNMKSIFTFTLNNSSISGPDVWWGS